MHKVNTMNLDRLSKSIKKAAAAALLGVAAIGLVSCGSNSEQQGSGQAGKGQVSFRKDTITVSTTEVSKRDFQRAFNVNGTLVPRRKAVLHALVGGKVTAVKADISERVKKGEVLLQVRKSDYEQALAQARANYQQARVARDNALKEMKRARNLFDAGSMTAQQRDRAVTASREAEARLQQAKAAYQSAKQNLEDATVRAPYDGVITGRYIDADEFAKTGQQVFQIMDLGVLDAELDVPESYAGLVTEGLNVPMQFKTRFKPVTGKVVAVNPKINRDTRTFTVKVRIHNDGYKLPANLFVTADFDLPDAQDVPAIPKDAVERNQGKSIVWVISNGEAHARNIVEGQETDEWLRVRDGLKPGEVIAVDNTSSLIDGYPVRTTSWKSNKGSAQGRP